MLILVRVYPAEISNRSRGKGRRAFTIMARHPCLAHPGKSWTRE